MHISFITNPDDELWRSVTTTIYQINNNRHLHLYALNNKCRVGFLPTRGLIKRTLDIVQLNSDIRFIAIAYIKIVMSCRYKLL